MVQKLLLVVFFVLASVTMFSQIKDPVKWKTSSVKKGEFYDVVISATLPKPWHIYSQKTGNNGPLPTKLIFNKNPLIKFVGVVKEKGVMKEEYDKNFDTKVKYYGDRVDFIQTVKVKGKVKTNVGVNIEYMTCDDKQCLPPTKKTFNVVLK